jgi:peptide/nickel transport system substrate-binding protein
VAGVCAAGHERFDGPRSDKSALPEEDAMLPARAFRLLAVLLLIAVLGAACKSEKKGEISSSSSSPSSASAGTPASSGAVTRQNTLVIATPEDVVTFDPPVGGNDLSIEITWQIYEMPINAVFQRKEGILVQDGDKTEPWLAEKVDVSADGQTVTFKMRKGVKFYPTGNEMTAKDLDWAIRRELEMKVGFGKVIMATASVTKPGRIVDDYTYELTLDKPNVASLAIIALVDTGILDSTEAQKHATADDPWAHEYVKRNSLGTGPYYLASYQPGQQVVLEAVPNYWRQPAPFFKRIVYRTVPDPAVRLTLLKAGEVDIAQKLTGQELKGLEGAKGLAIREALSPRFQMMWMNTLSGPTADLNVRRAIAAAVPYKDILNAAFFGAGRPHDSFFMPDSLGYTKAPSDLYATDLNKARSYLAQSQYANGFKIDLAIDAVVPEHEQAALLVQQALKPLNIEVSIVKMPTAQFRADGNTRKLQLAIHQLGTWITEGTYIIPLYCLPDAVANWSGVGVKEINDLLPTLFTPDANVRRAGYERIQRLWNEQVPYAFFGLTIRRVAMASNLQNFTFSYSTHPQYYFVSRS